VVDEYRCRTRRVDVVETTETFMALRLVVHGAGDPTVEDDEAEGHEAHGSVSSHGGQAGDRCGSQRVLDPRLHRPMMSPRRQLGSARDDDGAGHLGVDAAHVAVLAGFVERELV
jgi:hypothetical protein